MPGETPEHLDILTNRRSQEDDIRPGHHVQFPTPGVDGAGAARGGQNCGSIYRDDPHCRPCVTHSESDGSTDEAETDDANGSEHWLHGVARRFDGGQ